MSFLLEAKKRIDLEKLDAFDEDLLADMIENETVNVYFKGMTMRKLLSVAMKGLRTTYAEVIGYDVEKKIFYIGYIRYYTARSGSASFRACSLGVIPFDGEVKKADDMDPDKLKTMIKEKKLVLVGFLFSFFYNVITDLERVDTWKRY